VVQHADIDSSLPLSESTYLILVSLAPGPKHGYAIMKEVAALSGDRVQLSTGTLYGALKRLLAGEWIRRAGEDPPAQPGTAGTGRRRRYYALTDRGAELLAAEVARLEALAAVARPRLQETKA
jgi:DNA-binding PadR family transcriptional regulator